MVGEKLQLSVESIIGQSCRVEGNVLFCGGLRVDGIVRGNVCAEPAGAGYLVVSPKGRIEGCVSERLYFIFVVLFSRSVT